MRSVIGLLWMVLAAVGAWAQSQSSPAENNLSPAERSIVQAKKLIAKNPKDFEAYNALALALSRRARLRASRGSAAKVVRDLSRQF